MTDLPPPSAEDPEGAPPPPYPSTPPGPAPSYPPPGSYQQPPAYPPGPYQQPPGYPPAYGGSGYFPPGAAVPGYPGAGGWAPGGPSSDLASYPARLGGWIIDFVILFVVYLVIRAIFRHVAVARITINTNTATNGVIIHHHSDLSLLAGLLQIAIVLLYGALFCGSAHGQTPGMMAVSVKAVDARTRGPIGFWRGLGRAAFEWVLWIVFILPWVLDMLFPLWDLKHQTLHDKVSGTVVIKALSAPPT